jgi:hypothetical protein
VTRSDNLEIGFVVLVVVYVGLAGAVAWLLRRLARRPPSSELTGPGAEPAVGEAAG